MLFVYGIPKASCNLVTYMAYGSVSPLRSPSLPLMALSVSPEALAADSSIDTKNNQF